MNKTEEETLPETQERPTFPIVQQGIVSISTNLVQIANIIPTNGLELVSVQGHLRDEGIFAEVHRNLLLPDSYTVVGIFYEWWTQCWQIVVESNDILPTEAGLQLPIVELYYICGADGVVHLSDMKITYPALPSPVTSRKDYLRYV